MGEADAAKNPTLLTLGVNLIGKGRAKVETIILNLIQYNFNPAHCYPRVFREKKMQWILQFQ